MPHKHRDALAGILRSICPVLDTLQEPALSEDVTWSGRMMWGTSCLLPLRSGAVNLSRPRPRPGQRVRQGQLLQARSAVLAVADDAEEHLPE